MHNRGDTITWKSANGLRRGIVEDITNDDYMVRLPNGKHVAISTPERILKDDRRRIQRQDAEGGTTPYEID